MMMMMMMMISAFGPAGCGRPLRGTRYAIYIYIYTYMNRTQPFIEGFLQSTWLSPSTMFLILRPPPPHWDDDDNENKPVWPTEAVSILFRGVRCIRINLYVFT
jgi:hypothetical protein